MSQGLLDHATMTGFSWQVGAGCGDLVNMKYKSSKGAWQIKKVYAEQVHKLRDASHKVFFEVPDSGHTTKVGL